MRDVNPPAPIRPAITLPEGASATEVADFARGVAVLERLARQVAELLRQHGKDDRP